MEDSNLIAFLPARKRPWNKGRLTGQKPPLQPKHVWAIRTRLQLANKIRDLALFNLAIDSKLRGCDVVRLRTEEIAPNGVCVDRATIRQRKTGWPVRFEITEQTRQSVLTHLKDRYQDQSPYLFPVAPTQTDISRRASMRGWYPPGWKASGWMHLYMERTHSGGPRQP
jgi:integrase